MVVAAVEEGVEAGVEEGIVAINRVNNKEEGDGIKQHNRGVMVAGDNKEVMGGQQGGYGGQQGGYGGQQGYGGGQGGYGGAGGGGRGGEVEIGTEGEEVVDDIDSWKDWKPVLYSPALIHHHVVMRIRLLRIANVRKEMTSLH